MENTNYNYIQSQNKQMLNNYQSAYVQTAKANDNSNVKKIDKKEEFDWKIILWVIGGIAAIVGAIVFSEWLRIACPILFFSILGIREIIKWFE